MPTLKVKTGIELYYEVHGSGDPIVLIPGTGLSCDVWKEPYQLPDLAETGQVILVDPRGCGRSTAYKGVYTIESMAQDISSLLEALGAGPAHVIGHSMGGRIGLSMALEAPGQVASLVMAAAGSGPAGRDGEDCIPGLPFWLVNRLVSEGYSEFLRKEFCETDTYFTDDYRSANPEAVTSFYERAMANHAAQETYIRLAQARHNFEVTHRLRDVDVPVLIMVGGLDTHDSSHVGQAEALKRIPNSEYALIEGQSHGFFWQDSKSVNERLKAWIARHQGT